jgi:hypothetical protein
LKNAATPNRDASEHCTASYFLLLFLFVLFISLLIIYLPSPSQPLLRPLLSSRSLSIIIDEEEKEDIEAEKSLFV